MYIYAISQSGVYKTFQVSEGAEILRYSLDTNPTRAPDSNNWVGDGEGQPVPQEVTVSVDMINTPNCVNTITDHFSSATCIGVVHNNGTLLVERRVLSVTGLSIPEAEAQWGRLRVSLMLDAPVYDPKPLTDHYSESLTDNRGDFLYVIEEV